MGANRTGALVLAILSALLCQALLITSSHAREAPHAPGADHLPGVDDPPATPRSEAASKIPRYT
uniref:Uncharacterized protein n=1 Tax=Oryza meridionalis TaxID=40149 RepID=A0A0E0E398_9ORYZ